MPSAPPRNPVIVRPMLAKHWKFSSFIPGMYIQPKLDGLRAMYQNGQFVSRDGKVWQPNMLKHIVDHLRTCIPPTLILDGELYCHGMPLQAINARAAVNRLCPHDETHLIEYHVFDCVAADTYGHRFLQLRQYGFHLNDTPVKLVQTYQIFSHDQSDKLYQHWLDAGYEGAMYRKPDRPYATPEHVKNKENRCDWLLKRKEWSDIDGIIVRLNEGEGANAGRLGSFTVRLQHKDRPQQHFNVGTGLSDVQRRLYWDDPWRVLNRKIKVKFRTFSVEGIPLEPRVMLIDECHFLPK